MTPQIITQTLDTVLDYPPTLPSVINVQHPIAEGYGALLVYGADKGDDLYLQLAPTAQTPILRQTAQPSGQMPNTSVNPEDFRPESGRIFSRAGWSSGEGLARAHRADPGPDDAKRFWSSQNIRITVPKPGEPERFFLAAGVEEITGSGTPSTPYCAMVAEGRTLHWADGAAVKYCQNLLASSPTIVSQTPGGGTVVGVGILGNEVYSAHGVGGIYRKTMLTGSYSLWSTLQATALWCVKNRVIAAVGTSLYDAAAADGSVLLKTLSTGTVWTDVCDAGHLLLASASDGMIYAFADQSGSLVLQAESSLRPGEVPYTLGYADGLIFIGTGELCAGGGKIGRLYVTQASGSRIIGTQLIREWGDPSTSYNHTPGKITASRDAVLIPVLDDDHKNAVWAYMLPTAGTYCRVYYASGTSRPQQAFDMDGRVVLVRVGNSMLRETTSYASTGWLMTPYADWYSAATKAIIGLRVESPDLPGAGARIDIYYATDPEALSDTSFPESSDSCKWALAASLTYTGGRSITEEIPLEEVSGRGIALRIKLTRTTAGTASPTVYTVSSRAFENLAEVLLQLPVNCCDIIERPGKTPLRVRGRGNKVYAKICTLEGQPVQLEMLRIPEKIKGRVEQVGIQQAVVSPRGTPLLVALVTVRGVKVEE